MKLSFNKWTATISLIILVLTLFSSVIVASVSMKNNIETNNLQIQEFKESTTHISDMIVDYDKRLITVETHYVHIADSLERIEDNIDKYLIKTGD